jgi:hypothetical protein
MLSYGSSQQQQQRPIHPVAIHPDSDGMTHSVGSPRSTNALNCAATPAGVAVVVQHG